MTYLDLVTTHHATSLAATFSPANAKSVPHDNLLEQIEYAGKLRQTDIAFFHFIFSLRA